VEARENATGGDREVRRLVEANMPFVFRVARQYQNVGIPLEDLRNEGIVGLIEAARRYDPDRGTKFSTYAVWWIRAYITRCLKDGPSAVRRTMPNGGLPPRDISLEETLGSDGDSDATHLDRLADEGPGPDAQLIRA
jgi:RNA polymerase primary sigma factor